MRMTKIGVVLLSLALSIFLTGGPNMVLASGRSSNQQNPALAYNTQREEYLLVWSDDRGRDGADIWARRLFTSGLPVGGAHRTSGRFQIAGGAGNQDQPAIAYNIQRDEYLVVFSDDGGSDTGRDIYAQRLFTSGLPVGRSIRIYVGPGNQTQPAITYSSLRDEYLVVWADDRDEDKGWDIYGQRVETNGLWTTGRGFLIATGGSNQQEPAVAFSGDQYVLLWTDDRNENFDIRGKRIFASGLPIGGAGGYEFGVATGPSNEMAAALPTTGAGVLVWSGDVNFELKGMDLFGLRLFDHGLPIGRPFGITAPEANQVSPALAYNPDRGEFLVVWSDDRNEDADLFALRLLPTGLPVGRDFPVFTDN